MMFKVYWNSDGCIKSSANGAQLNASLNLQSAKSISKLAVFDVRDPRRLRTTLSEA